jgi:hypothetical protein
VTLPLSLAGPGAGLLLSFVLAAGSYVTPQILGGRSDSLFWKPDLRHDHEGAELADGHHALGRCCCSCSASSR